MEKPVFLEVSPLKVLKYPKFKVIYKKNIKKKIFLALPFSNTKIQSSTPYKYLRNVQKSTGSVLIFVCASWYRLPYNIYKGKRKSNTKIKGFNNLGSANDGYSTLSIEKALSTNACRLYSIQFRR